MPFGSPDDLAALGRRYVHDPTIERVPMDSDYRPVLMQFAEPIVIIEWDLAISQEDRARFDAVAQADPDSVQVAPYRLYPVSTGLPRPVWAHREVEGPGDYRWIEYQAAWCNLFSFGLVYLPAELGLRYVDETTGRASDATFSLWHFANVCKRVPVHWNVRPIHLHY